MTDPSLQSETDPEQMKQAAGDELARRRPRYFGALPPRLSEDASPAATTTPVSVRIFETLLHRAWNELLNSFVEKKGSAPDPSQLLRGQDPARYLIIILMETIKDLYVSAQPQSRSTQRFSSKWLKRGPKHS